MTRRLASFDPLQYLVFEHGFVMPPKPAFWRGRPLALKECIESAVHMTSQIDLLDQQLSSHHPDHVRAAYFRAAMSELGRIEDVLKSLGKDFSFSESTDPSLHVIKLLRNYQVHISSITLSAGEISISLGGEKMAYRTFVADNVTAPELRRSRASAYSDEQLAQLAQLFNTSQRKLGVVQFLYHLAKRVEAVAKAVLGA